MKKFLSFLTAAVILISCIGLGVLARNPDSPVIDKVITTVPQNGKLTIVVTVRENAAGFESLVLRDAGKKEIARRTAEDRKNDGSFDFSANADAEYYLYAYDVNGSTGNPDGYFLDRKSPSISTPDYDDETYTSEKVNVTFNVTDTGKIKSVNVKTGSTTVKTSSSGNTYEFEAEKNGEYAITAEDEAGNVSSTTKVTIDKIDKEPPVLKTEIQQREEASKDPLKIEYTVTDNVGIGSIYINGKTIVELEKPRKSYSGEYIVTESGEVEFDVHDLAGNVYLETVDTGVIDLNPPVIERAITMEEIAGVEARASVLVTDETELTYEWFIMGGMNEDWAKIEGNTPAVTINNLRKETTYTLRVTITDEAGNSVSDTKSFTTLNNDEGTEKKTDMTLFYIIGGIVLFIIASIGVILFLLMRSRNNNDDDGGDDEYDDEYDEYDDYEDEYDDGYDEYGSRFDNGAGRPQNPNQRGNYGSNPYYPDSNYQPPRQNQDPRRPGNPQNPSGNNRY